MLVKVTNDEAIQIIKRIDRKANIAFKTPEDRFLSPAEIEDHKRAQRNRNDTNNNNPNEPANFIKGLTEEKIKEQIDE